MGVSSIAQHVRHDVSIDVLYVFHPGLIRLSLDCRTVVGVNWVSGPGRDSESQHQVDRSTWGEEPGSIEIETR